MPEQRGGIVLDHDLRLEVEAGREAEILVRRPCVTVGAPVFAAAIRIDARGESDVGTLIPGDDRTAGVSEELCGRAWLFYFIEIGIPLVAETDETVRGILRGSTTSDGNMIQHEEAQFLPYIYLCTLYSALLIRLEFFLRLSSLLGADETIAIRVDFSEPERHVG